MGEPVNVEQIREKLGAAKGARMKMWLDMCAHCGLCAESCFFYLAHDRDPSYMPSYKVIKTLGEMYKRKGNVDRAFLEEAHEIVWGKCTACRRCTMYCPFGIDIASMIAVARGICNSQGVMPEGLNRAIDNYWAAGNQMAMSTEDWIETCSWMAEETGADMPGLTIPMDKEGANLMYTVNAREPMFYPQDIAMAAQVFTVAGEDWTMPSEGWDDTNLAMFAGDAKCMAHVAKLTYDAAIRLKVKHIGVTECGHAYRHLRYEAPYWLGYPNGEPPVPVIHSVELFAKYLREGRIKIDPAKKLKEPVTYQDPCNLSRNGNLAGFGREIMSYLADDFREMTPNREHNHCCGGGGGFIPMGPPFKRRRIESGKVKAEQIRATGAKLLIVPCHNCFDQIRDLSKEYDLGIHVKQFKEVLVETMLIPEQFQPKEEDEDQEE
jgi:Fe-S oxidoreductase